MNSSRFILSILMLIVSSSYAYKLQNIPDKSNVSLASDNSTGCECSTYSCGCCTYVNTLGVKGSVCANASYLPNDYGFTLTLTFNNYTLINETISATNPPPFCVGLPELEKMSAEICLVLSNLDWRHHGFSGCVAIKISVYHTIHKSFNLGCFHIPNTIDQMLYFNKTKNIEVIKNDIEDEYKMDFEAIKNLPTVQII